MAEPFRAAVAFCAEDALIDDIVRWWKAPAELAARAAQFASTSGLAEINRAVDDYLAG